MAFFSACQQDENEIQKADDLRMSIVASINGQKNIPASRYVGDDPSNVDFEVSDAIGVFVDNAAAMKWTYISSGWSSENDVYWPDKTQNHTFCAFYPYVEATSIAKVPMPSLLGQSGTIASISKCDFLVASVTQSCGTDGIIAFREENAFSHVSSLVQLTFKGDGDLSSAVLTKISIEGKDIVASSTYSFSEELVSMNPDAASDVLDVALSHPMEGKDATFYFILNEKEDASEPVVLTVEYKTDDKTYVARMENFAGNVFVGGVKQSYTITIKERLLIIDGSSISSWGAGESLENIVINGEEQSE